MRERPSTRTAILACAVALALALALAACGGSDGTRTETTTSEIALDTQGPGPGPDPVVPNREPVSVYWGAEVGEQLTGAKPPWDMSAMDEFEQIAGRKASLLGFAMPFADCNSGECVEQEFEPELFDRVRAHGAIPFFSWASQSIPATTDMPDYQLRDVTAGRYDDYIRRFAEGAAAWGHPFFLRFNWEMNGGWFPWGVDANGNRTADYVPAWRHVHDIFEEAGADNVTWVWCPNIDLHRNPRDLAPLYPGDEYVDWTCLDGFNWGIREGSPGWLSFDEIFSHSYRRLIDLVPDKPVILGETASSTRGGSKPAWIKDMLATMPRGYPRIRGFVWNDYFDRNTNWPIETSKAVTEEFRRSIAKPWFLTNDFGDLAASPIPPPPGTQ